MDDGGYPHCNVGKNNAINHYHDWEWLIYSTYKKGDDWRMAYYCFTRMIWEESSCSKFDHLGVNHTAQQGGKLRVHWVYRNTRLTTFDANYVLIQNVHRTTAADHRSVVWNRFPKPQYPPWTPRWPINLFWAGVCGSSTTCRSCSLVWDRPTTLQK